MNNKSNHNHDYLRTIEENIDPPAPPKQPSYVFYFRCRACDTILNHNSYNVKNGIQESPYCSKCSASAFDTSDSSREYEHQMLSDLGISSFIDNFD